MTSVRHLALWLAAAIVMIAVSLMPSAASAHAGHRHDGASIASASAAPTASAAAVDRTAQPNLTITTNAGAEARLLCTGPCCAPSGHVCSSCCSVGLMPAYGLDWTAPRPDGPELARDVPRPPGIVPEALPEPPRPLA